MDTSTWSPWPGTLTDWQANWTPADGDPPLPPSLLASDSYFQLATRPLFQLRDNEPLTEQLQAQASPEQIRLFAVYVTDKHISNGGFWQWLGNSYSCLYPSLLEGHRMLGLPGIADLIEDAVRQVFPDNNPPLDHDTRNAALNRLINIPDVDEVVDQLNQRDLRSRSDSMPVERDTRARRWQNAAASAVWFGPLRTGKYLMPRPPISPRLDDMSA